MSKNLTVGELLSALREFPPNMKITFGSSRYTKRPLAFNRFKRRGENLLHIEIGELDTDCLIPTEQDCRKTVGYFIENLESWPASANVTFGSTIDAVPLEFNGVSSMVSINLEQNQEPEYIVRK
jgi:hypothetical protein